MTQETMAKVLELMENEDYEAKLEKMESADELIKYFADNGVTVTADDLKSLADGEIGEAELDSVAGGLLVNSRRAVQDRMVTATLAKIRSEAFFKVRRIEA